MLIEYRVLRVEFRNYKLLSSFAGVLRGLLGLQHLDTFPWGLEHEGMRIVRECKVTGGEMLPSEHADGCVKLAKDGVDGLGGGDRGWHVAVFGTLWASGTGGIRKKNKKNVHPHNTATTPHHDNPTSSLYIRFISPPSIREDNRAVKIKPVCLLAAGAALFVLWMWTAEGLW